MHEEQETVWYLEDSHELADAEPYTFYIPSAEVIALLEVGDSVQLMFSVEDEEETDEDVISEALWVRITQIEDEDYWAVLETEPELIPDLQTGDEIAFSSEHIIDTQREDPVPNIAQQYAQGCFVTARVLDDEHPVGALYREDPSDTEVEMADFSGWNIMAGDEDDDYLDDADNWHYVSLGTVLNIDDRIIDVLDAPYDSDFEFDPEQNAFVELEDEA